MTHAATLSTLVLDEGLARSVDAALYEAFGVRFDLWVKVDSWKPVSPETSPDGPSVPSDCPAPNVAEFLDESWAGAPKPRVLEQTAGSYVLAIPMPREGSLPLIATATFACCPDLLLRTARLFVNERALKQQLEQCHQQLEAYATQVEDDLEELLFLSSFAEHMEVTDTSRDERQMAESVLPHLRSVVQSDAVVLVSARAVTGSEGPPEFEVVGPVVWEGSHPIDDEACCRLVRRFREAAAARPVVKNRFTRTPDAADFPNVREMVLVPVTRDDLVLGWLLALNRPRRAVADARDGSAPRHAPWERKNQTFGSVEVNLLSSTAAMLATYARNVGLLREKEILLVETDRAKSEFLANMSHELRTPLTAILGFSDTLLTEGDIDRAPSQRIEAIRTILHNGDHLLQVIDDVLDLSKIEAGKSTIQRVRFSPLDLAREVQSLLQVRAQAKGISVRVEPVYPIPETILSDPARLRQILLNLVGNAIKFTDTGSVRLILQPPSGGQAEPTIRFDVIDTGIGMTRQQVEDVFKPFSQADSSMSRRHGGTGLGLAISQRLADMLGGGITVESQPNQGSTFRLAVCAGPMDDVGMITGPEQAASVEEKPPKEPAATETVLAARILLAEDGIDNQRIISFFLERAGADVVIADNGEIAVAAVWAAEKEGKPFDVILMDMQMPVLDGYQATEQLRRQGYTRPIIALTAHSMEGDRKKCIDAGCDDYTTKPIKRETLLAIVADHLET